MDRFHCDDCGGTDCHLCEREWEESCGLGAGGYQSGADAFDAGDDFDPNASSEWKAGWRDAQDDEDRNM